MIRTIVCIGILVASVLWLPLWVQLILFVGAVFVARYRIALLAPAVFADALYAQTHTFTIMHFKMTIVVTVLLVIWYIVVTQTRLSPHYD